MTTPPGGTTRVLLIDDDEALGGLLTEYLGQFAFTVKAVAHPDEGLRALRAEPPDIVVLDVMLPGMDGFAVCRKVRETSAVPIVMLTARGDVMDRIVGLELGADDYLPKPFEPRELVARIQAVLRRGAGAETQRPTRVGPLEVSWEERSARIGGRLLELTTAEFELLGVLVKNRGRVLTRDRIMEATRGVDWEVYDRSIDVLVSRLRQKLGDDARRPTFIKTVHGAGYSFIEAAVSEGGRVSGSIFAKLVGVMLVMAFSLLALVASFFQFVISPNLGASVDRMFEAYTQVIAASSPDLAAARDLAPGLGVRVRYEGPAGSWTTDERLPSIEEARRRLKASSGRPSLGHSSSLVAARDGGTYLFYWGQGRRLDVVHNALLALLLLFMVAVVFAAHVVLRNALEPLRSLREGVRRLSEGDLEVALEAPTPDEFGELTQAFNGMVARVREMVRARDQLLLDVSHELRSPLTRMKVALALLPDGEKRERMAADVSEMEAMIGELLELERLREGRGLTIEPQDLVPVLREVAEAFWDVRPGVRVVSLPAELPLAFDPVRVRSVFRNLLENATKYSLPDSRPVEVSAAREGADVVVRVVDDGPGVPEADLSSLFEPFFRVDRSRSKRTGGYGLGLSICKRVMEAHGGTTSVSNNVGRGATFSLTFRSRVS